MPNENTYLEAEITSTGASSSFQVYKSPYNFSLYGTFVATIMLQRSLDGGTTWLDVREFTAPDERIGDEPEPGTLYRVNCTSYTSGTATARIGSYYDVGL